jgi:hypothetical protein
LNAGSISRLQSASASVPNRALATRFQFIALGAPTIGTIDPLPMANIRQESEFLTVRHHCNSPARCALDNAFFGHDHAVAVLLQSDGKAVHKVGQTEVGTLVEGIAFSPDGRYVYLANWGEQNLSTYQIDGDKLVAVGNRLCARARAREKSLKNFTRKAQGPMIFASLLIPTWYSGLSH